MATAKEKELWSGHPSHWTKAGHYTGWLVLVAAAAVLVVFVEFLWVLLLVLPGVVGILWTYLTVRARIYCVTTERLISRRGVLTRHHEELELFRVKDIRMVEPLWMRPLGIGTVVLITSDTTHPKVELEAIPRPDEVREILRDQVNVMRDRKDVREIEVG
jgi:uncharacterized membrane protein YdbT with pleckstrin-like domain